MLKIINITLYIFIGAVSLIIGGAAFFMAPNYAPVDSAEVVHIIREGGSGGLFVGLISIYCAFNYHQTKGVHYALLTFFLLFSGLHWYDFFNDLRPLSSGLINSIPAGAMLFMFMDKSRGKPNLKANQ
jgi:hypothetical protein